MADNEEHKETPARGNEWEVVSLTASAYAAAPDMEQVELNNNGKGNTVVDDEAETQCALFMSGHFVFPPSQHENLPLEPENIEIQGVENVVPKLDAEEGSVSDKKNEVNSSTKGLAVPDELSGIQYFDGKGNRLSTHGTEFEEEMSLQALNSIEKEQSMYGAPNFSSICESETTMGGSTTYDENTVFAGQIEPSEGDLDLDISQLPKLAKEDKRDRSELPCKAWWKRQATSLYAQAKEANAFWSVFVAATVMGIVMLGQHWQQERWQVLQLKWQFSVNDEKMGWMLGPIYRFKDVIVGGSRRASFIRGGSSTER